LGRSIRIFKLINVEKPKLKDTKVDVVITPFTVDYWNVYHQLELAEAWLSALTRERELTRSKPNLASLIRGIRESGKLGCEVTWSQSYSMPGTTHSNAYLAYLTCKPTKGRVCLHCAIHNTYMHDPWTSLTFA
jgi:hypothetical protein